MDVDGVSGYKNNMEREGIRGKIRHLERMLFDLYAWIPHCCLRQAVGDVGLDGRGELKDSFVSSVYKWPWKNEFG